MSRLSAVTMSGGNAADKHVTNKHFPWGKDTLERAWWREGRRVNGETETSLYPMRTAVRVRLHQLFFISSDGPPGAEGETETAERWMKSCCLVLSLSAVYIVCLVATVWSKKRKLEGTKSKKVGKKWGTLTIKKAVYCQVIRSASD